MRASFCLFPKTMSFDQDVKYISLDVNFGNEEFQNLKAVLVRRKLLFSVVEKILHFRCRRMKNVQM